MMSLLSQMMRLGWCNVWGTMCMYVWYMGTIQGARVTSVNSLLLQVTPNHVCLKQLLSQVLSLVLLTGTFGESDMRTTTRERTYVRTYATYVSTCHQLSWCVPVVSAHSHREPANNFTSRLDYVGIYPCTLHVAVLSLCTYVRTWMGYPPYMYSSTKHSAQLIEYNSVRMLSTYVCTYILTW